MWRDAMRFLAKNCPGSAPARRQAPHREARGDQPRRITSLGAVESPAKLEPGDIGLEGLPDGWRIGLQCGFAQPSWPSSTNTSTTAIMSVKEEYGDQSDPSPTSRTAKAGTRAESGGIAASGGFGAAIRMRQELHARMESYRQQRILNTEKLRKACGIDDESDRTDQIASLRDIDPEAPSAAYARQSSTERPEMELRGGRWGDKKVLVPVQDLNAARLAAKVGLHARFSAAINRERAVAKVGGSRTRMARLEPWGGRDTGPGDSPEKGTILRGAERKRKLDASAEAVSAKKIRREATVEHARVALWLPRAPAGAQVPPDVSPFFPAGFGAQKSILNGRGVRWADGECPLTPFRAKSPTCRLGGRRGACRPYIGDMRSGSGSGRREGCVTAGIVRVAAALFRRIILQGKKD